MSCENCTIRRNIINCDFPRKNLISDFQFTEVHVFPPPGIRFFNNLICYIVLTSDFGNLVNIWTEIFHKITIYVAKLQVVNFLVKCSPKRRETFKKNQATVLHQGLIFSCGEILLQCPVILYTYIPKYALMT